MAEIDFKTYCDKTMEAHSKDLLNLKELMHQIAKAQTDAIGTAKTELDHRLWVMNNLQDKMDKIAAGGVDRGLYEREHKYLSIKVETLIEWKAGVQTAVDRIGILEKDIVEFKGWKAGIDGKSSWSNLFAVIAFIIAAMSALFPIFHSMAPK